MDLTSQKDVCSPVMFLGELCTARTRHPYMLKKKPEAELLGVYRDEI